MKTIPNHEQINLLEQQQERICVGIIVGAHGVRGALRVKALSDYPNRFASGEILLLAAPNKQKAASHNLVQLDIRHTAYNSSGELILQVKQIQNRDMALEMRGYRLEVHRPVSPERHDDETYYHYELVGLQVIWRGQIIGRIIAVRDFGAHDLLEIGLVEGTNKCILLPFLRQFVPVVDIQQGNMIIDVPDELFDQE